MFSKGQNKRNGSLADSLESYLENTLHANIKLAKYTRTESLPSFLRYDYAFYESIITNRRCLWIAPVGNNATPSEIAKHIALVNSQEDSIVAFATTTLDAYNRARLIQHGVPFVVPGNQLYIPQLAMDLREHFRAPKAKGADRLTPVAQVVLFHYILNPEKRSLESTSGSSSPTATSVLRLFGFDDEQLQSLRRNGIGHIVNSSPRSDLVKDLQYTSMSIGRAFDKLVNLGLADAEGSGATKHVRFKAEGRDLLESAKEFIRSPVRTEKFVRKIHSTNNLKRSGETALAELSNLSPPSVDTFAVAASKWKAIAEVDELVETDHYQAEAIIETWIYDPKLLSNKETADPLSLYAQFHQHKDERVAMAANKILDNMEC